MIEFVEVLLINSEQDVFLEIEFDYIKQFYEEERPIDVELQFIAEEGLWLQEKILL